MPTTFLLHTVEISQLLPTLARKAAFASFIKKVSMTSTMVTIVVVVVDVVVLSFSSSSSSSLSSLLSTSSLLLFSSSSLLLLLLLLLLSTSSLILTQREKTHLCLKLTFSFFWSHSSGHFFISFVETGSRRKKETD